MLASTKVATRLGCVAEELTTIDARQLAGRRFRFATSPSVPLGDFNLGAASDIDRSLFAELGTGRSVETATSVLLIRPPGVGKTHIATALGRSAVEAVYRTYSLLPLTSLLVATEPMRGNSGTMKLFFASPTLLVIGELGHLSLPAEATSALFRIMNQR